MKWLTSLDLPALPPRPIDAHKGSAGGVLVVAGSYGMAGAAHLAACGARAAGAGYLRVACPQSIYEILAVLSPDAVFVPLRCSDDGRVIPGEYTKVLEAAELSDAAVVGCGLGETAEAGAFFAAVMSELDLPAVIDASGLGLLSAKRDLLTRLPGGSILTPHPGEMARLLGRDTRDVLADRPAAVRDLAALTGRTALLKGARTLVCDGEHMYENSTGNAGMATAGSGDVLSGLVAALVAGGLGAFDAGALGAYIHGGAGDVAASGKGRSLGPADIVEGLPGVIMRLERGRFERGRPVRGPGRPPG